MRTLGAESPQSHEADVIDAFDDGNLGPELLLTLLGRPQPLHSHYASVR